MFLPRKITVLVRARWFQFLLPVVVCMAIIAFTDVSASINYKEASCSIEWFVQEWVLA